MNRTFRLADLERSGGGAKTRFAARLTDDQGVERYELIVAGPPALIKKSFADARIEIEIDPSADKRRWSKHLGSAWKQEREAQSALSSLEDVPALFEKEPPPAPTAAKSVLISLRQLEPVGTRYFVTVGGFAVPIGVSLFFGLPPVCSTFGVLTPASGDQDLFLHLGWPPVGPIRGSRNGGTTPDVITFSTVCRLWTHFAPIWHLFGWRTGVCRTFVFGGTDIFG